MAIAIFVIPILASVIDAFTSITYYDLSSILAGTFVVFLIALALFISVLALEGYIVSLAKKRLIHELRLINEFIKFAQPPPPPPAS